MRFFLRAGTAALLATIAASAPGAAQTGAVAAPAPDPERLRILAASEAEHQRELALLGIAAMIRPLDARDPTKPNFANYDEAKANHDLRLPDPLTDSAGRKVTTPAAWTARRAELMRVFDSEIYGIVPSVAPAISWRVAETVEEMMGGVPVVTKRLIGHADNRAAPGIIVDILMTVTTPAAARGRKVPVVMVYGAVNPRPRPAGAPAPAGRDYRDLLLAKGWGFAILDTDSIQADNAAGLTQGVIGLANRGRPRSLTDWGVLRAWGWGASRGVDYLETDPDVDSTRIALYGHSRGGKAALVTMAYEPRFATGYISSSGVGGAGLYRRNFGQIAANLASTTEFHWFAGNFLKYAAVGRTADEMPIDGHELIAMVAPRPVFIGGGATILTPISATPGDGWVDARGMFLAAAAASPVWSLLGKQGLQASIFPPIETCLDQGGIGFRQHREGHTPVPNWPCFLQFASRHLQ